MAEDFDKPYVFVVYRVNAQYLDDNFLEKVSSYEEPADDRSDRWRENPWDLLIKVKDVFPDEDHAKEEIERLNKLNGHKGCLYFYQGARFYEDGRRYQQSGDQSPSSTSKISNEPDKKDPST